MQYNQYKTYDLTKKRPNVLILGNGLTRETSLSWAKLIKSIGRDTVLYVGAFWYVSLIPMVYMLMGAAGALRLKMEMTYRDLYSCYRRIKVASWILPVLFLGALVGEIVFLSIYQEYFSYQQELPWMIGAFILFLLSLFLFIVQLKVKNKIKVVKKKNEE